MSAEVNKKIGGTKRAAIAREEMEKVFSDEKHPMYFAKDIEFAHLYKVSRHTIYRIRDELKIPVRSERIITRLKSLDLKRYTIKQLEALLNVKYQNLYKLLEENNMEFKADVQPIEALKKFQKERKKKRQRRA